MDDDSCLSVPSPSSSMAISLALSSKSVDELSLWLKDTREILSSFHR